MFCTLRPRHSHASWDDAILSFSCTCRTLPCHPQRFLLRIIRMLDFVKMLTYAVLRYYPLQKCVLQKVKSQSVFFTKVYPLQLKDLDLPGSGVVEATLFTPRKTPSVQTKGNNCPTWRGDWTGGNDPIAILNTPILWFQRCVYPLNHGSV